MRVETTLTVLGIAVASAFALGPSAPAAPSSGPQPVIVTNTSSAPVPVSQASHGQPPWFVTLTFTDASAQLVSVTYPAGYTRLVIDKVGYQIFAAAGDLVFPQLLVTAAPLPARVVSQDTLPVPVPQITNGGTKDIFQSETTGLGTVVDSVSFLYVANTGSNPSTDTTSFYLDGHFEP